MKKVFKIFAGSAAFLTLASLLMNLNGCKPQESPSIYDPNWKSLPQPVVDSLSPAGSALAGLDTVAIYGKNFSPARDSDGVYFNSTLMNGASIISASANKLLVKAPALSGDSIRIRVYVLGAVNFSSTVTYKLLAAISPFGKLLIGETANGISAGSDTNLYVSISNPTLPGTKDEGIFRFTSDGMRFPYALPLSLNLSWTDLKFGPSGYLYAAKGAKAVYRFSPGGGTAPQLWAAKNVGNLSVMDFDPDHNMWAGGNNKSIYRINPDTGVAAFAFNGNVHSIRYFDGYLYFAATNVIIGGDTNVRGQVYRAPVSTGSLGTPELYFDLSTDPSGGSTIYAITFSADRDMYAGVDSSDYLIVVHPNGQFQRTYSLYAASGALNSPCKSFAWIGTDLYTTTASGEMIRILVRKPGAPYYGLQ
ncbi:MAG TPA: IPT/TIG domain-containing protein [Candidatus Kryptonia bacterium]